MVETWSQRLGRRRLESLLALDPFRYSMNAKHFLICFGLGLAAPPRTLRPLDGVVVTPSILLSVSRPIRHVRITRSCTTSP